MNTLERNNLSPRQWGLTFKAELGIGVILLILVLMGMLGTGCQTRLAPGGVYNGDVALYEAENAIVTGHDLLQDFVDWEKNYRPQLAQFPEVRKLADKVFTEGPQWFASADALRAAYAASPTPGNKTALQTGIDVIHAALREATGYLTANKSTAPPSPKLQAEQKAVILK